MSVRFPAYAAGVRFWAAMRPLVVGETRRQRKRLPARVAHVRPHGRVLHLRVPSELTGRDEGFLAGRTNERFNPRV